MSLPENDSFAQRIACARREDQSARARLLEQYRPYLSLLARMRLDERLRAKVDAADIAQETLAKAYEHLVEFRGKTEAELLAWLRRILVRNLIDTHRRYGERGGRDIARERSLETQFDQSSQALGGLIAAQGHSPSQSAARREMAVVVAEALESLRPDHREVIVLRGLQELDWPEVAEALGRSEGAARMLWVRALQALRPLIEGKI